MSSLAFHGGAGAILSLLPSLYLLLVLLTKTLTDFQLQEH